MLFRSHAAIEVVGEAAYASEALTLVAAGCDAIFLDIEMPGLTGIDAARLIRSAHEPPAVVFVTAHAGYAVDAFAVEAFDYLLKPVDASTAVALALGHALAVALMQARGFKAEHFHRYHPSGYLGRLLASVASAIAKGVLPSPPLVRPPTTIVGSAARGAGRCKRRWAIAP